MDAQGGAGGRIGALEIDRVGAGARRADVGGVGSADIIREHPSGHGRVTNAPINAITTVTGRGCVQGVIDRTIGYTAGDAGDLG